MDLVGNESRYILSSYYPSWITQGRSETKRTEHNNRPQTADGEKKKKDNRRDPGKERERKNRSVIYLYKTHLSLMIVSPC